LSFDVLSEAEERTLATYVALLEEQLGPQLLRVAVFGSAARGERWPAGMPLRSDLDLLVIVREPLDAELEQELVDATYPLFLESGRQISPQFRTAEQHAASPSRETIERDAIDVRRRR
jgi:predicted nucleotidyltransferase